MRPILSGSLGLNVSEVKVLCPRRFAVIADNCYDSSGATRGSENPCRESFCGEIEHTSITVRTLLVFASIDIQND